MADAIAIQITNVKQIKAAFAIAPQLMTKELNTSIRKSILTIQRQSMKNTPVDTGRLRASHRSLFSNLKGEVGTNTDYDIFVHNGTKFMQARPFLSDAAESSDRDVQDFFLSAVSNVLYNIGKRT